MSIIKFLIEDFKSDIKFVKDLLKGNVDISSKSKNLTRFSISEIFQEYWIWFLILILAFCVGWTLAALYYSGQCNEIIMENMYNAKNSFNINLTSVINYSLPGG